MGLRWPRSSWANIEKCSPDRLRNGFSSIIPAARRGFVRLCVGKRRISVPLFNVEAIHGPSLVRTGDAAQTLAGLGARNCFDAGEHLISEGANGSVIEA